MPQYTIICPEIPEYLRKGISAPKAAGEFLVKAQLQSLDRQPLDAKQGRPLKVTVSDELVKYLCDSDKKTPTPVILGEYVNAYITKLKASVSAPADAQRSVYQRAFYDGIASEVDAGKIVLAEGATGIGKGRVLARIAKEQAEAGHGPVAIAAPSVAVLKQLIEEWLKAGYPTGSVSCVLGKQQFVDTEALRQILTADNSEVAKAVGTEKLEAILSWLDKGTPVVDNNQNTTPLKSIAPMISCLDADLLQIAPELEPFGHHYLLNDHTSTQDPGYQAYSELRETAREDTVILFCTHAMIAYDIMAQRQSKNRILPEYKTLLVDEAHLFERNMANIHTHNISIQSLRNLLRSTEAGSKAGRDACAKLCSEVMAISSEMTLEDTSKLYYPDSFSQKGNSKFWLNGDEQRMFESIVRLKEALSGMMKKSRAKDARLDFFRSALDKVATTAKGIPTGYPILVNNTPIRRWPIITTGKRSVEKEFTHLWEQVRGAVLVSATLSVPSGRSGEGHNREYIYNILHIPPHRGATPSPVVPSWVTKTPVLHMPDPIRMDLCYPAQEEYKDKNNEDIAAAKSVWHKAVALEIADKPGQSAVGGTLVLLSSYEDIEGIGTPLSQKIKGGRVLLKTKTSSLEKQKQQFKEMARAGERPIWLAVGNAWTGLDLRDELITDEHPEQDTILTDLVIPRINFADNQSISHLLRKKKQGSSAGFTEAAFTLRQGLGRLVRRPGVKDRHIWFLDNRINHRKAQYNVFRNILGVYEPPANL